MNAANEGLAGLLADVVDRIERTDPGSPEALAAYAEADAWGMSPEVVEELERRAELDLAKARGLRLSRASMRVIK